MSRFSPEKTYQMLLDLDTGGGEGGGESGGEGGVLAAVIPTLGGDSNSDNSTDFSIPAEYAEKGWAKDLKSSEDVFKKLDGAESLIGRQVKVPDENTSTEDRNKFFEQFRPENAAEYKFDREGQSEEMKKFVDEKMDVAVKDLFHKAGLAPWQAELLQKGYENEVLGGMLKDTLAGKEAANAEFDKVAKEAFGENEVSIMEASKKLIEAHTPEGFGDMLASLPNEQAMALAGLLSEIQKSYIDEGTLNSLGDPISAEGEASLFEKGKNLMETPAYQDEFHPDHVKTKENVDGIFKRLGAMAK